MDIPTQDRATSLQQKQLERERKKDSHHVHYTLVQQGYNVVSVSTFWRQKETFYNLN